MTDKPSNFDIIAELVKETSGQGNIISLPRIYLKIAGDVVVGLFLSQCVWYSDKGGSHDGWFYKSNKEWQEEIGLSYAQVKRAAAKLEEMGILHIKLKKAGGAPTTHYYVDMDSLTKLIFDFLEIRQNGGVENQESLKSDFQESSKSITALTQSSTGTALTEGAAEKPPPSHDPTFLPEKEAQIPILFPEGAEDPDYEQVIKRAGWQIRSVDVRRAVALFLEHTRLQIPFDKPARKDWLKHINNHVKSYGLDRLRELYPAVVSDMCENRLPISRPGSVTNPLAALVGEINRNGGQRATHSDHTQRPTQHQAGISQALAAKRRGAGD